MRIQRNFSEPKRITWGYEILWNGPDQGLIASWERGREKALEDPELSNSHIE